MRALMLGVVALLLLTAPSLCSAPAAPSSDLVGGVVWDYVWKVFFDWMLTTNFSSYNPPDPVANLSCNATDSLWRRHDGSCNNLEYPGWGMSNSILRRLGPAVYVDGAGEPRNLSARALSNGIFGAMPQSYSKTPLTLMEFTMGQFFLHDLVLINMNYSESWPIPFPPDDPSSGGRASIPFWRAEHVEGSGTDPSNPRQYRNAVTQWIDLNTVYGSSEAAANLLRANDGTGRLRMSPDGLHLPLATAADLEIIPMQTGFDSAFPTEKTLYLAGDIRANQNYMLLAFHTLFAREHNRWCAELAAQNPDWDDELLYQNARQLTIAVWQSLLIHEFSASLAGLTGDTLSLFDDLASALESHYLNTLNPMAHVAWDILYRLHPTLTDLTLCNDTFCSQPLRNVSLSEMYFNAVGFNALDLDTVFLGLANTPAAEIAPTMNSALRNVQVPIRGQNVTVFDLAAYDLQRMADLGVGTLNDVRAILDLDPIKEWTDITSDESILGVLQSVYASPDTVDAFPGVMAEAPRNIPLTHPAFGPSIQNAIGFQALVYSFSDRFFFLRPGWLTPQQVSDIRATKLSDVILRNTNITCMPNDATYYRWNKDTSGPSC